jgi:hypothetical protein
MAVGDSARLILADINHLSEYSMRKQEATGNHFTTTACFHSAAAAAAATLPAAGSCKPYFGEGRLQKQEEGGAMGAAATAAAAKAAGQDGLSVAIVGAGFSGLCMGIQLKKAGFDNFTIFEAADAIGELPATACLPAYSGSGAMHGQRLKNAGLHNCTIFEAADMIIALCTLLSICWQEASSSCLCAYGARTSVFMHRQM